MEFNIEYWYMENYLPTTRHRKPRERYVKSSVDVNIKEPEESEFPVAFIVKDCGWICEEEEKGPDFKNISTEIRTYAGELWKAVRYSDYVSRQPGWAPVSYIKNRLEYYKPYWTGGADFSEKSIILDSKKKEAEEAVFHKAKGYLIFDGKIWEPCGEPMYVVMTFGLGHNHGGTGFFIEYSYNENISKNNYFNALERDQAIAYGKKVAANRGDTNSIDGIGERKNIEVLMPEMVKRNPQKEHGNGDSFMNAVEAMINMADSVGEAGLLATLMCAKSICEKGER